MGKKAVLVGCNYPGTKAELKGCINDVHRMRRCLVDRFGFADEDIVVLIDTDSSYTQPTGANIRRALSDLVTRADAGDVLFFHYSGHGVRLPPKTTEMDEDDATGYDECIVPCDWNLITDDDFRDLVDKVPEGCRITIVSDSCHSGGLIDKTKEQIGESTKQSDQGHDEESYSGGGGGGGGPEFSFGSLMNFVSDAAASLGIHLQQEDHRPRRYDRDEADEEDPSEGYKYNSTHGRIKKRSLPLPTLVEMLKQKKGEDDIDVGKIRPTLLDVFGDDASPKVKKFMKSIIDGGGLLGMVGSLAQELLQSKPEDNEETYVSRGLDVEVSESDKHEVHAEGDNGVLRDSGILISGCQTDQESVDAKPSGGGAYGALSNAIQIILGETTGVISNKELVLRAREMLSKDGLRQRPGLYCSDDHVEGPFIC